MNYLSKIFLTLFLFIEIGISLVIIKGNYLPPFAIAYSGVLFLIWFAVNLIIMFDILRA